MQKGHFASKRRLHDVLKSVVAVMIASASRETTKRKRVINIYIYSVDQKKVISNCIFEAENASKTKQCTRHHTASRIKRHRKRAWATLLIPCYPLSLGHRLLSEATTLPKPTRASDLLLLLRCPDPTITPENTPLANCNMEH